MSLRREKVAENRDGGEAGGLYRAGVVFRSLRHLKIPQTDLRPAACRQEAAPPENQLLPSLSLV